MRSGDVIQERYRLEETLGSGGMAEVWRAADDRLKRSVAIKFPALNLAEDPEFMVRFFSEAQAVARLSHPNVVKVLDFGEHEGRSYLVMEHVPGGSLLDVTGPIAQERARELIRQAALGAGAAHAAGVVHRDIKPGNVLIDDVGNAKLADFGIAATAASERLTATGAAIGSPHYISPEQASGGTATAQSDVYALGVVLYELLTGVRPIEADNLAAIAIAQIEEEPRPPRSHAPDIDPELETIVMSALAKDPAQRYADGNALAAALDTAAQTTAPAPVVAAGAPLDEPDQVEDHEPTQETGVPARRTGWIVAGAGVALLLAIVAIALLAGRSPEPAAARPPGSAHSPSPSPSHRRHHRRPSPTPVAPGAETSAPSASPSPASGAADNGKQGGDRSRPGGGSKPKPKPQHTRASPRPTTQATPVSSPSP